MQNDATGDPRLNRHLPPSGPHRHPALLVSDTPDGPASRMADQIEAVQLDLAQRLLSRVQKARVEEGDEPLHWVGQLCDALADVLVIARCRGDRLAAPGPRAGDALAVSGADLASARAARRHVRDAARARGLDPALVDDLESIAGELVANALEHTVSHTIAVGCAFTGSTASVSVTDEGGEAPPVRPVPARGSAERGRGLLITHALADRWGTRLTRRGLTVWAELDLVQGLLGAAR
ncbi:ATP-binding protein [Streptomyces sp. MAA16]|uniref:ATP-binding protein n=1 Tax=Streptomyces sp. MAA16 TaxID=3035116 RepID=UPI002474A592|nr:ATP-binding protein [Streptomyces sp. MAA16]MDH6702000.1 anti-sigma regulatory factor (Ser/Thr protein kinase) [Streptomyces sp. MAA16]